MTRLWGRDSSEPPERHYAIDRRQASPPAGHPNNIKTSVVSRKSRQKRRVQYIELPNDDNTWGYQMVRCVLYMVDEEHRLLVFALAIYIGRCETTLSSPHLYSTTREALSRDGY